VVVQNHNGGTIDFNGTITSTSASGILLANNTASTTIRFDGTLNLSTGSNTAFSASPAGSLAVTGSSNQLTSTTGVALDVRNTTITNDNLTFLSISSNGAVAGVYLENTGPNGGLVVTGTGTTDNTGGTLRNSTGDCMVLRNTREISLANLQIQTCGQMGIRGETVAGFSLVGSQVVGAGNGNDEHGLYFTQLSGDVLIQDTLIDEMEETGIRLYNTSGTLDLALLGVTISDNDLNSGFGEDGLQFQMEGNAIAEILVDGSTFTRLQRDGIDGLVMGSAHVDLTVRNNSQFTQGYGSGGVNMTAAENAVVRLKVTNTTFQNTVRAPVNLVSLGSASLDATLQDNTLSQPAPLVSQDGSGIQLSQEENSQMTVELDGNTVNNNGFTGLEAAARLATTGGSLHLTLTDNEFTAPSPAFDYGAWISQQDPDNTICLDSGTGGALANTIAGSGGYQGLAVIQNGTGIFRIEGLGSGTLAAVTAHLQAVNSATTVYAGGTAFTPAAAGACRSPGLPTLPSSMVLQEDLSGTQLVNLPAPGGCGRGLAYPLPDHTARAAADEVGLNLGVLPTGKSIRVTFEAVVSASMPEGVFEISNQAQVAGSNFTPVLSDDPAAPGPANPTVTPLYRFPLARADSYATPEETPLTISAAAGVLANDLPSAGYTLTAAKSADPAAGTVDLYPDGSFTFTPPPNGNGPVTFQYTASDGISISPPAVVTVLITGVNDAPVLDNTGSLTLPAIFLGAAANPGITVSALLASGGGDPVSDTDPGALEGIAVIGVDSTHGTWQYTLNGQDWLGFNNPSSAQARLVAADGVARLRFLPQPDWSGTVDPGITFRAWDRTSGVQGETGDASQPGGSSAFSLAVETAAVSVQAGIDLVLTVSAPAEPVMAGTNLTYTASLYNAGPSTATNVVLSSRLTTGLSFVTGSPDCSSAGNQVSCRLANLASGASADFSVTTRAAVDQNGVLTN
jgi:uncharacterized repeat protein (TIGR01451 family)